MRCIFCKQNSDDSKSIEHIIPESLGNIEHILEKGIVCDRCNNYFAIKIEQPLLKLPYFISLRYRNDIESKKGRIPVDKGILFGENPSTVNFHKDKDGLSLSFDDENSLININETFTVVAPQNDSPPEQNIHISKLLGKIGLEALAKIGTGINGGIDEIIEKKDLDKLRNYVRYGSGVDYWEYYCRKLYPENSIFTDENEKYKVLHEYRLLYTEDYILFIVVIIMGIEYCLNLTNPKIDRYAKWLRENNNASPLYGKN